MPLKNDNPSATKNSLTRLVNTVLPGSGSIFSTASLPDRLTNLWQRLIGSYWFIPTLFVLIGTLLGPLMTYIDQQLNRGSLDALPFIFLGGVEAARSITSAIAGAVLGVAGTTFSITIAVLTMASSQFGPRLLRNFLTDKSNQVVLGVFIGTFSYCLLVLKAIRSYDSMLDVPQLAVTLAIVLALACALLLIYFVQHTVHAIQASHIIEGASHDALQTIHEQYHPYCDVTIRKWEQRYLAQHPDIQQLLSCTEPTQDEQLPWRCTPIYAPKHGYIQELYLADLTALAYDYGGIIVMRVNIGEFVTDRNVIAHLYRPTSNETALLLTPNTINNSGAKDSKRSSDADHSKNINSEFWQRLALCLQLGLRPLSSQGIDYSLGQMTEIAVRALSPGINDPKTAVNCVQALTSCLSVMMRRNPPSLYHFYWPSNDQDNSEVAVTLPAQPVLTVMKTVTTLATYIDASLGEIRRYAVADLMVLKALCQAMIDLSYSCVTPEQQQLLLDQLELIKRAGQANLAYDEPIADLIDLVAQAKAFIGKTHSQRDYFRYQSAYNCGDGDGKDTASPV